LAFLHETMEQYNNAARLKAVKDPAGFCPELEQPAS
jgi:hypothetical protein